MAYLVNLTIYTASQKSYTYTSVHCISYNVLWDIRQLYRHFPFSIPFELRFRYTYQETSLFSLFYSVDWIDVGFAVAETSGPGAWAGEVIN